MSFGKRPKADADAIRKAALGYAKLRLRVLLLRPGEKIPAQQGWPEKATADRAEIKRLLSAHPKANLGLAMGGGVLALDVDNKNGHDGDASLKELEREHGKLPRTRTHATPNGGRHLFFRCEGPLNNVTDLRDGIDIKGDAGQVAAPPSVTEHGAYSVISDAPIADAPDWLIAAIESHRERGGGGFKLPLQISEGSRDATLYKYACQLRHNGDDEAQILEKLRRMNDERCSPPLSDKQLHAKAKQACKYAPGTKREAPAFPDEERVTPHSRTLAKIMLDKRVRIRWLIEGLFALGVLVILGGSPKAGKTTLLAHLLLQMRELLPALDKNEFVATKAARDARIGYFNEMGDFGLKQAIKDVKPDITDDEIKATLTSVVVYDRFPQLDADGLQDLERLITEHEYKFFILDTIARLCPPMRGLSASEADAKIMTAIRAVAQRTGCCICVVTQANKRAGDVESVLDRLAHTNQFAAAADDIVMVYRKKDDPTKVRYLAAIGRNVRESDEMVLRLDETGLRIAGTSLQIMATNDQREIAECLHRAAPEPMTANAIAATLGKKRNAVQNILYRMKQRELVVLISSKRGYMLPLDAAKAEALPEAEAPRALPKPRSKLRSKLRAKGT